MSFASSVDNSKQVNREFIIKTVAGESGTVPVFSATGVIDSFLYTTSASNPDGTALTTIDWVSSNVLTSVLTGFTVGSSVQIDGTDTILSAFSKVQAQIDSITSGETIPDLDASKITTGVLTSARGGTGNGFTKFSGAADSEKTYTLPNQNATIVTSANMVANALMVGSLDGNVSYITPSTNGNVLVSNGTTWVSQAPAPANTTNFKPITISGLIDGTNKTFTLGTHDTGSEMIIFNGQVLTPTNDYVVSGTTLTLTAEFPAPPTGSVLRAYGNA
jgi:hypothetical protein